MARALTALLLFACMALSACETTARTHLHRADFAFMAKDYATALLEYEAVLKKQPDSKVALFGKAKTLHALKRFEEAIPLLEQFLAATEKEPATYSDERFDAEFLRDKAKQELGLEVEQNTEAIPPPPMGE